MQPGQDTTVQSNNEAVYEAQDPEVPTQRKGKGKGKLKEITVKYSIGVIFG